MPLQAAVDGAARQRGIDAAPHRLGDVVERQGEAAAQLDDQGFFPIRHHRGQPMRTGRAVDELGARLPPRHGPAVDAELAGQRAGRGAALLDIGAGARRRGGIGVQLESITRRSPGSVCSTRVASRRRSPRWVHRNLPRAAPPDSRGSRRGRAGPSPASAGAGSVDYRDELRLLSQQQTLLHHLESLPQPRTLTPIFRDTTRRPGAQPRCSRHSMFSTARSSASAWRATAIGNSSVF